MSENAISELLKKATSSNDINDSIDYLKDAYLEISKTNISYPISTFLRLPMYLQQAGRPDEALIEFENLLKNGYPNQMKLHDIIPMDESQIYDKMRLFYQREKQFDKAVPCGIYSILLNAKGLYLQKRYYELNSYKESEYIISDINKLLKKAKKQEKTDYIINIVKSEFEKLPDIIEFSEFEKIIF